MEAGLPRLVGSGPTLPPASQRVPLTGKAVAGARSLGYRQRQERLQTAKRGAG